MEVKKLLYDAVFSLYEPSTAAVLFQQYHAYLTSEYYLTIEDLSLNLFHRQQSINLPPELKRKLTHLIWERTQSASTIDSKIKHFQKLTHATRPHSASRRKVCHKSSANIDKKYSFSENELPISTREKLKVSSSLKSDYNNNHKSTGDLSKDTSSQKNVSSACLQDVTVSCVVLTDTLDLDISDEDDCVSESEEGTEKCVEEMTPGCEILSVDISEEVAREAEQAQRVNAAIDASWRVYMSEENFPYHFNSITQESSWDCPLGLYLDRNDPTRQVRHDEDEYYRECECIAMLTASRREVPFIYTNEERHETTSEINSDDNNDTHSMNTTQWNDLHDDVNSISGESKSDHADCSFLKCDNEATRHQSGHHLSSNSVEYFDNSEQFLDNVSSIASTRSNSPVVSVVPAVHCGRVHEEAPYTEIHIDGEQNFKDIPIIATPPVLPLNSVSFPEYDLSDLKSSISGQTALLESTSNLSNMEDKTPDHAIRININDSRVDRASHSACYNDDSPFISSMEVIVSKCGGKEENEVATVVPVIDKVDSVLTDSLELADDNTSQELREDNIMATTHPGTSPVLKPVQQIASSFLDSIIAKSDDSESDVKIDHDEKRSHTACAISEVASKSDIGDELMASFDSHNTNDDQPPRRDDSLVGSSTLPSQATHNCHIAPTRPALCVADSFPVLTDSLELADDNTSQELREDNIMATTHPGTSPVLKPVQQIASSFLDSIIAKSDDSESDVKIDHDEKRSHTACAISEVASKSDIGDELMASFDSHNTNDDQPPRRDDSLVGSAASSPSTLRDDAAEKLCTRDDETNPRNWEVCFTDVDDEFDDEIPYHFNFVTGTSVWECPLGRFLQNSKYSTKTYRECECVQKARRAASPIWGQSGLNLQHEADTFNESSIDVSFSSPQIRTKSERRNDDEEVSIEEQQRQLLQFKHEVLRDSGSESSSHYGVDNLRNNDSIAAVPSITTESLPRYAENGGVGNSACTDDQSLKSVFTTEVNEDNGSIDGVKEKNTKWKTLKTYWKGKLKR